MIVGVLDVQGDVSEHVKALERALKGRAGKVVRVKTRDDFKDIDSLVIPGGESTTIGKLLRDYGLDKAIVEFARKGNPVMGTCAGLILMAKEIRSEKRVLLLRIISRVSDFRSISGTS